MTYPANTHALGMNLRAKWQLPIPRWLRAQKPPCPWDESACMSASLYGHWDVLHLLRLQIHRAPAVLIPPLGGRSMSDKPLFCNRWTGASGVVLLFLTCKSSTLHSACSSQLIGPPLRLVSKNRAGCGPGQAAVERAGPPTASAAQTPSRLYGVGLRPRRIQQPWHMANNCALFPYSVHMDLPAWIVKGCIESAICACVGCVESAKDSGPGAQLRQSGVCSRRAAAAGCRSPRASHGSPNTNLTPQRAHAARRKPGTAPAAQQQAQGARRCTREAASAARNDQDQHAYVPRPSGQTSSDYEHVSGVAFAKGNAQQAYEPTVRAY